ncbi:MAG: inorganic phosphate transporter [Bacteroidales bacterium]|nr:inorganic phosphate transporter [Bacteroidales bacterium]
MDNVYLILIVVLFLLAVSDLIVGVSNDAVNFLNSAIGARAAPFRVIMLVAAAGVLFGATFSSGMMEVARKGIFHPEQFFFSEIIIIFLAVMITDVILLDVYNTFGLPTSTTVSIVFELLGASVAISLIKISKSPETVMDLGNYINSAKALAIISGILVSVVIAFSAGAIIQYFTRLIFTFNYSRTLKYFGAFWGGTAISAITYFMIIKGAKGSSFISPESLNWIHNNTFLIVLYSLAGWTILLQILKWLVNINILKVIILIGTFALAMAFAGNDMVNFIGVPLAGLKSYQFFSAESGVAADQFLMTDMQGAVSTPTFILLLAGVVMVITLWTSRKAKSVVATTIQLSRQQEGRERFSSTVFSRFLVHQSRAASIWFNRWIPGKFTQKLESRFEPPAAVDQRDGTRGIIPEFDMIRASVNLVVASILIALGTSLKLPLSTTYVTFMVAMGTSLADRAWGRESAVYRITGVLSVVGGWFVTALSAFLVSFLIGLVIYYGGFITIAMFVLLSVFLVYKTHSIHRKRLSKQKSLSSDEDERGSLSHKKIFESCSKEVHDLITKIPQILSLNTQGLAHENIKVLKANAKTVKEINRRSKDLKDNVNGIILRIEDDSIESAHHYVQVLDYLREIAHCLNFITKPSVEHVDNNHKGLSESQTEDLNQLNVKISGLIDTFKTLISNLELLHIEPVVSNQQHILQFIDQLRRKQVKRVKQKEVGTKNTLLFLNILAESKNLTLFLVNLLKSHRDFIHHINGISGEQNVIDQDANASPPKGN